jgi:hypothetical protein
MSEQRAEIISSSMTLEQCHDSILQGLMQGMAGHYRIGLLYNHIVENRLAVDRGYRTTREYFRKHVRVLSQSTLTMYGAVARSFRLPVVEKYGMAQLGALLEYLRLAHVWLWQIDTSEPAPTPIELPRRGGLRLTKPFSDCTAKDMRDAIQARRAWPGHGPLEPEEEPVQRYLQTLQSHFADNSRCPPRIDSQVHGRRLHLRIRHLRVWELPRLTEALGPTLKPTQLPVPATPSPTGLKAQLAAVASSVFK